ncbi:ABC transporter ATP-binding protein [Alicyclobacillus dauci]|uniref:ABC transporter ATP-binding protein n=1 Tax=Alicyclobacillus dauci TaxID=1475485 RepID=A0ABY6YYV5_9BACL|nr:ABC transporter ATP-binding protein [Alicyclobacillus dauci]WAH35761.1 ABC transporter ATP-binding protein [Alicyclobacillus dauci]
MSVLSVQGVTKKIGSRMIVEDVNMSINEGEIYGFLGPNGAGKTTTIRMIVGLIKPTKGTIRIAGYDIQKERSKALSQVGTIVENPETYGYLTGQQNLIHYARLAGIPTHGKRIREVLDIVGLTGRENEKVRRYSLGMRQRLGLAQALLARPQLLVLDEPTNGLDPAGMREFRGLMQQLADTGMAVFVSSHLLSELEQICHRVAIIKSGRIIAEEKMSDITEGSVRSVSVRVNSAIAAEKALLDAKLTAQVVADNLLSVQIEPDAVPHMVRTLVSSNVDIFSIEPVKESLENTFLDLTDGLQINPSTREIAPGGDTHA